MCKREIVLCMLVFLTVSTGIQSQEQHPMPGESAVPAWFLGMPVFLKVRGPVHGKEKNPSTFPDKPTEGIPRTRVYLAAPLSKSFGNAPSRPIPTGDGEKILPAHQAVLTELRTAANPALGQAYFILMGPKANDSNVHVQPDPGNSVAGGPLVYEIKIGHEWVKLSNHVAIEYGIQEGLLKTKYLEDGGVMWGEFMDPGMEKFYVEVSIKKN